VQCMLLYLQVGKSRGEKNLEGRGRFKRKGEAFFIYHISYASLPGYSQVILCSLSFVKKGPGGKSNVEEEGEGMEFIVCLHIVKGKDWNPRPLREETKKSVGEEKGKRPKCSYNH